jgi:hypothetical protein
VAVGSAHHRRGSGGDARLNVRALLEPALDPGQSFTWDDVIERLKADRAQLWTGERCAMITELHTDQSAHVWLAGGSLTGLLDLMPECIETARFWGVKRITIKGRKGWDRALRQHGFRRAGDFLEMAI